MNRRRFIHRGGLGLAGGILLGGSARAAQDRRLGSGVATDVLIVGGGMGGCTAAMAALSQGMRVVLTEETDWIGGQVTSQGVPPDEHQWIESHGATKTYRAFRESIREYYRRHYPLTEAARRDARFNPGRGSVSRICCEPRVALAVLEAGLAAWRSGGRLMVLLEHRPVAAGVEGDRIRSVTLRDLRNGHDLTVEAGIFLDATEFGDLLPLAGAEFVTGAEGRAVTGEWHQPERTNPDNHQAFTTCFAADHVEGEEHVIEKPAEYDFWRSHVPDLTPPWPGRLLDLTYSHPSTLAPKTLGFHPAGDTPGTLNLWTYRRIADPSLFEPGAYPGGISLINWPQNDYMLGNLFGGTAAEAAEHDRRARQLSLSLLYWLQTEVPRPDGGHGWPGLRLRGDLFGTADGLAKYPYVRESRRIRARFTILEEHVGREQRADAAGVPADRVKAAPFADSIGIGYYHIDLHPSSGGDNYIDFASLPFRIPLGALVPVRLRNLLPACKNIGTTHVTNGCYRLHPVEWNIGESAGHLAAFCLRQETEPAAVLEDPTGRLADFQALLTKAGIELEWPEAE